MKKLLFFLCVAASVAFLMSACRTVEKAAPLSSINGEWNIVEINGAKVHPAQGQSVPFIGFDTSTGKLYGSSGCNRMMGSFDINAKAGTLELGAIGSTRMMCPDMMVERNVLGALGQVKGYKVAGKDKVFLCNASNRPVVVLERRIGGEELSALAGEWKIAEVDGEAIPTGMKKQPFLAFDVKNKTLHGNVGCNIVNGGFDTNTDNSRSISFPGLATTMMACPDMEVEGKILKAMNEVKTFGVLAGGGIGLYDANDKLVVVLTRK